MTGPLLFGHPHTAATTLIHLEIQHLATRLQGLYANYRHLELHYSQLPLVHRRHLLGQLKSPIPDIRKLAEAKFLLAAALQWSPTSHGFDIGRAEAENGLISGVEQAKRVDEQVDEGWDELCPIWIDFATDIVTADRTICAWNNDPQKNMQNGPDLRALNELVMNAEAKYTALNSLFVFVSQHGGFVSEGGDFVLEPWMVYRAWNRFCVKLATFGMGFAEAVMEIRSSLPSATEKFEMGLELTRTGKRKFFGFQLGDGVELRNGVQFPGLSG